MQFPRLVENTKA